MKDLQDLKISANSADSLCTTLQRNWRKVAFLTYPKKTLKIRVNTKGYNGKYLVWEEKKNFLGFRNFRVFRGIDLAHFTVCNKHSTKKATSNAGHLKEKSSQH